VRWEEVFAVFLVCHLAGDFLLQTDWQAINKRGGLAGTPEARRALVKHVVVYTLCFLPALVWLSDDVGASAFALLPVIFIPHLLQDDGRLLQAWNRRIKRGDLAPGNHVYMAIDQSFHVVTLFATALLAVRL
jgi:hypothetical protein